ncbi:hypothetical protein TrCOL_g1989 [Triparma columacea]|uniref:Uncharacterized protein n=1 Tax=Triparma columacea TaxID=722753 RepID=A0A9W7GBL0_9STRA|nr:hypothetical protein TrCOL_g1989 [Triparma columacea]
MPEQIEPAALDSDLCQLAAFGMLDGLKKLLAGDSPTEEEGEEPAAPAIDLNQTDERGCSPLVWASRNGHLDVVSYLIDLGAEVDVKSFGKLTALHHACNSSVENCVAKLIEAGADVNATDEGGNSCLHWAVARGVLNIIVRLTDAGADITASNNAGVTPLQKATIFGQVAVVKKLIDLGSDVNSSDSIGMTPLHIAASCGFKSIVSILRKNGAAEVKNNAGKTPSDLSIDKATTAALTENVD